MKPETGVMRSGGRRIGGTGLFWIVYALTVFAFVTILALSIATTVLPASSLANPWTESFVVATLRSEASRKVLLPGYIACLPLFLGALAFRTSVSSRLTKRSCMIVCLVCCVVALVLQVALIRFADTRVYQWGDSELLMSYTNAALTQSPDGVLAYCADCHQKNLIEGIEAHHQNVAAYLMCYPFQTGMFFLFVEATRILGDHAQPVLQAFNALCNVGTAACLVYFATRLVREERRPAAAAVASVTLVCCLPLWVFCLYVYGNQMGLFFALAFLVCQYRAAVQRGPLVLLWELVSLASLSLCLLVKSTFVLVALGTCLAWLIVSIGTRRREIVVRSALCLVVFLAARSIGSLPQAYLEQRTGIPTDRALTTLSHLEIGLHVSPGKMDIYNTIDGKGPFEAHGWYSGIAVRDWVAAGGDPQLQNELAFERLRRDFHDVGGPIGLIRFLAFKTASEWCYADSQATFFIMCCSLDPDAKVLALFKGGWLDRIRAASLVYLDAYQSVTYALFVLVLVARLHHVGRDVSASEGGGESWSQGFASLLLICTIFAGAGCYLLWEAKAVYVYPFYLMTLPFIAAWLSGGMSLGLRHSA